MKQHYIPASHIARFSNELGDTGRNKKVWVMRNDVEKPFFTKSGNVGFSKDLFTLERKAFHGIYDIDNSWAGIEGKIGEIIKKLDYNETDIFDAIQWCTILIPFISQLLVRSKDYVENILKTPIIEAIKQTKFSENLLDNINMSRLIDYQRLCWLLITSSWLLLRNNSKIPYILNDRGYCI